MNTGFCSYEFLTGIADTGEKTVIGETKLKNYGDVWRLDLDIPGTTFDKKHLNLNLPYKVGCYRRCYACHKIGMGYFRCHGTCGGKQIYCSVLCQRKLWKMHKIRDGCSRRL